MATNKEYEELLKTLRKRPRLVLEHLLDKGEVSTYELGQLGYDQPPRAAQDLKEAGVQLKRKNGVNPVTGNRMAIYSLDRDAPIGLGLSGRKAFPKSFVKQVKDAYNHKCCVYDAPYPDNALQVDHRVPYIVAGEAEQLRVEEFMTLCGSAQRLKSWACEHCPNRELKDVATCESCYWAYPHSDYQHIATVPERRADVVWKGKGIKKYNELKAFADDSNISVPEAIRQMVSDQLDEL